MIRAVRSLAALLRDERGTMMIETAIVAPVLVLLSLGAFQISQLVARQTELQGAAAEASSIALAAPPENADERAILKNVIVASTGLTDSQITVSERFRCGATNFYVSDASLCAGTKMSTFVLIEVDDVYTPAWVEWGLGSPITYNVNRYVMVKQS